MTAPAFVVACAASAWFGAWVTARAHRGRTCALCDVPLHPDLCPRHAAAMRAAFAQRKDQP